MMSDLRLSVKRPGWWDSGFSTQVYGLEKIRDFRQRNIQLRRLGGEIPRRPAIRYTVNHHGDGHHADQGEWAGKASLLASVVYKVVVENCVIDYLMRQHFTGVCAHCLPGAAANGILLANNDTLDIFQYPLEFDPDSERLVARFFAPLAFRALPEAMREQLDYLAGGVPLAYEKLFAPTLYKNPPALERLERTLKSATGDFAGLKRAVRDSLAYLEEKALHS